MVEPSWPEFWGSKQKKAWVLHPSLFEEPKGKSATGVSREFVRRADFGANRLCLHINDGIAISERGAAGRANHRVLQVTADVGVLDAGIGGLFVLERPLLNGAVDLAEVIDAGVRLRGCARLDEVRN